MAANGLSAGQRQGLGSSVIFDALAAGEIDAYVDYSGTLWANQMRRTDTQPRDVVLREVADWLKRERGIVMLGALGFENAYALVVPRKLGISSIAELAARAPQMRIAGDYEFFARPEWQALRSAYGLNFREQRQMQAEFMYPALSDGQVDVIAGYSSDGQIAKFDLMALSDPKQAIPPYDAVLLVSPKRANDEKFLAALRPLIGAIPIDAIREANFKASAGGADGSAGRGGEIAGAQDRPLGGAHQTTCQCGIAELGEGDDLAVLELEHVTKLRACNITGLSRFDLDLPMNNGPLAVDQDVTDVEIAHDERLHHLFDQRLELIKTFRLDRRLRAPGLTDHPVLHVERRTRGRWFRCRC